MGLLKLVVGEAKAFEVVREGKYVLITERGWKGVNEIRLGVGTPCWFSKAMEDCLKIGRKEFYSTYREGVRRYIAQK